MLEISPAAVAQWELETDDNTSPRLKHLSAFVAALGITEREFYGRVPGQRKARA